MAFLLPWPEQTVIVIKIDIRVLKADRGTQLGRNPSHTDTVQALAGHRREQ